MSKTIAHLWDDIDSAVDGQIPLTLRAALFVEFAELIGGDSRIHQIPDSEAAAGYHFDNAKRYFSTVESV
jgi:hypothetical protein